MGQTEPSGTTGHAADDRGRRSGLCGAAWRLVCAILPAALILVPNARADETWTPSVSAIVGVTSNYVFRGISLRNDRPSPLAWVDARYGPLYATALLIGTTLGEDGLGRGLGNIEADLTVGATHTVGQVDFNVGVKYTGYPNGRDLIVGTLQEAERDFIEPFAGTTWRITDEVSIGGTAYWTPDYYYESGRVVTLEAQAAWVLPKFGPIVSKLNGAVGRVRSQREDYIFPGDGHVYFNAGIEAHLEKMIFDLRYWGTDVDGRDLFDDRVVVSIGTLLN